MLTSLTADTSVSSSAASPTPSTPSAPMTTNVTSPPCSFAAGAAPYNVQRTSMLGIDHSHYMFSRDYRRPMLSALVDHRTRTVGPLFTKCPLSGGHVTQVQRTAVGQGALGATLVRGAWHSRLAGKTVSPCSVRAFGPVELTNHALCWLLKTQPSLSTQRCHPSLLPASFRSRLTTDTLAFRLPFPCRAGRGLTTFRGCFTSK